VGKGKVHLYSYSRAIVTDTAGEQPGPQPKPAVTDFGL